ncbi:DNA adenine methylase [Nocardioides pelophilus]|uniref:DNA adenine methylase n=1 Tax=Nocardioides pelophilus TaxID=2172019 RepID=UPI00160322C6|nr:DNA adenine methylase [Nocardioides pelophilus]
MIKYLGSKRTLVPVLGELAVAAGARTALDLFTGTTRVAQELKRRGIEVTACDLATYSAVLSDCFVATDAATIDDRELDTALARLDALPGRPGYFTETFCERARFFQPHNGARVDAIRDAIDRDHPPGDPLRPILLTSLMVAADRVDSTTGVQMAYLKQWAPRAHRDLRLERPALLPGAGTTIHGDASTVVDAVGRVDLAYVDPPYNQHRYFTNYHIWETLIRWDAPEHYGVACKRVDSRDADTHSVFNSRRTMPAALADVIHRVRAEVVVVSYNDESWITADEMTGMLRDAGHDEVRLLAFDRKRYVGALIGIHNPAGKRVGEVGRRRNVEHVLVAGPRDRVDAAVAAAAQLEPLPG